jgi:cell division protein FtsI (penicillin-binding protein 3)
VSTDRDILRRTYIMYAFMCVFGLAIMAQIVRVTFVQGDYWRSRALEQTVRPVDIEAARGNIFAEDGSLLATSKPFYEVRWDANVPYITDDRFNESIEELSRELANLFRDKSWQAYKRELTDARRKGSRYHLIRRDVDHKILGKIRKLPLFKAGRFKGGLIYLQKSKRSKPFSELASRTIGYDRPDYHVGLEGAYSKELSGVGGQRLMQKIAGGVWKPLSDGNDIEPKDGNDLVTSIDINIQDVAEHALYTQLSEHGAESGCAVLMEVSTGEIKAIANLKRKEDGTYRETYNYAVGAASEPGSTFKLASIISLLDDGFVDISDSVDTERGKKKFYDRTVKDSHPGKYGKLTIQKAFEVSSNVAISSLIQQHYGADPGKFVGNLRKMGLGDSLGLEIPGEGKPMIKDPSDPTWSGVTLPWMSFGYEVLMTPMQTLTLYNAIANDGVMVKPQFIKSISKDGQPIKEFGTTVLNKKICSQSTLDQVKILLEGVVEDGTARNLRHADYAIAGKTGTALIAKGGSYKREKTYQASFVGYFPAEAPRYSCIVVVNSPSKQFYYGNVVAGPIFKEISDKVYSTQLEMHAELAVDTNTSTIPSASIAQWTDLNSIYGHLNINTHTRDQDAEWVYAIAESDSVTLKEREFSQGFVPRVIGMAAADAIYLLENAGMTVELIGSGRIYKQSIIPGTRITNGRTIVIELA